MKIICLVIFILGLVLFGIGMSMRTKQIVMETTTPETIITPKVIKGTTARNAAIGAGTGAVVGGGVGAGLGGVGLVCCGTGIGLPVGIVCLTLAGAGALLGGSVGAVASRSDRIIEIPTIINRTSTQVLSAYSPAEYWSVLLIGMSLMAIGAYILIWTMRQKATGANAFPPAEMHP